MDGRISEIMRRTLSLRPSDRWLMLIGGVLWAVFGYYRFMTPFGADVLWREDLGYSQILKRKLFILYNLPGVLALLMTTGAAFRYVAGLRHVGRTLKVASRLMLITGVLFGLLAAVGQLVPFDAFTTGGLSFGTLFLGLGVFLAGLAATLGNKSSGLLPAGLMLLGSAGLLTVGLRPLMYALQMLPLTFGAAACALFGLGWILLGLTAPMVPRRRRPRFASRKLPEGLGRIDA